MNIIGRDIFLMIGQVFIYKLYSGDGFQDCERRKITVGVLGEIKNDIITEEEYQKIAMEQHLAFNN